LSDHATVNPEAGSDAGSEQTFVLRDGRLAVVAPASDAKAPAVERLIAAADPERRDLYAQGHAAALVARDGTSDEPIGFVAYSAAGDLLGVVDPRWRGVGLGTLLLEAATEHARDAGLQTLQVDLTAGSEETAVMLRDAALAARWDIDYPVTRVTLDLASRRPGWTTPLPRPG
jgi:GNAT superfamily N-acetyltransferase